MGALGPMHWLIVLALAVLLFGNRLPTVGKSLGEGIRNFKKGMEEDKPPQNDQAARAEESRREVVHQKTTVIEERSSLPQNQQERTAQNEKSTPIQRS